MNKEWSEQNKRMQSLIKKADTFNEGKDVLFELRNDLMNTMLSWKTSTASHTRVFNRYTLWQCD